MKGLQLPISTKQCVEICRAVRNLPVSKAQTLLTQVMAMQEPIPYKRYNANTAHRPGALAAGRFPLKAVAEISRLLKSAQEQYQGTGTLYIHHISAHKGIRQFKPGRKRGRKRKATNVYLTLQEK